MHRFVRADADLVPYTARIVVWARWAVWVFGVFDLAYRPNFPDDSGQVFVYVILATYNGMFHYRILTNRPVT